MKRSVKFCIAPAYSFGGDGLGSLAGIDPFPHRHLIPAGVTQSDKALFRQQLVLAARILALGDGEYRVAIGVVGDRRLRQGHQADGRADRDADVGEHARPQQQCVIGDGRAQLQGAGGRIDRGTDCRNFAPEHLARKRIDSYRNRLSDAYLRQRLLRHIEIHEQRVELLQGDDLRAGSEVLTDVHLTNAKPASERGFDDFLRHQRLLRLHLRLRRRQIGVVRIHLALRDGVGLELLDVALIGDAVECGGGLQLRQHRVVVIRPQGDQQRALRDIRAGFEMDGIHDPRDLGGKIRAVHRDHAADRVQARLPG
jgi:hypothetical protein